ncbi:hypothetical protein HZA57_07475 [Candidatus Poribacteria bacterium]|nr:hypothetical protein [Candidatus Poribacteria bacterium]
MRCIRLVFAAVVTAALLLTATQSSAANEVLGSGDGQIHVIPAMNPSRPRDGDKVTFSAVIKSRNPVASVTATVGGQTITLQPKPMSGIGALPTGETVGVYEAEWTASGLDGQATAAAISVRDASGHEFTALLGREPQIAGHSAPGTTDYPNAGMRHGKALILDGENDVRCVVVDPVGGAAYFGTDTSPGYIVKIDLDSFTRVGAVSLAIGEDSPRAAVIDVEARAA